MPATVIILARAGSKGLPGKNMLPVAGKPCAQWTIEHALHSRLSGDESRTPHAREPALVVVSTDDTGLLDLTRHMSAQASPRDPDRPPHRLLAVARPPELAGDRVTIDAAARHAVESLQTAHATLREPDHPVVILYANVPVRPSDLTDRALATLRSGGFDSVQSYAPVGKHHPWWTARVDPATAAVRPWEGTVLNHGVFRRQDLPAAFIPDGGVIALRRRALMLEPPAQPEPIRPPSGPHAFLGREDRRGGIVSGPRGDEVVDIDSRIDLLVAEALLREAPAQP